MADGGGDGRQRIRDRARWSADGWKERIEVQRGGNGEGRLKGAGRAGRGETHRSGIGADKGYR